MAVVCIRGCKELKDVFTNACNFKYDVCPNACLLKQHVCCNRYVVVFQRCHFVKVRYIAPKHYRSNLAMLTCAPTSKKMGAGIETIL